MSSEEDEGVGKFEAKREQYIDILRPVFCPSDPVGNDIVNYFSSLLRVLGIEEGGWDPFAESKAYLEDFNGLTQIELPKSSFPEPIVTKWRLGLMMYSHIVEMAAPYDVVANLLRFQLGEGYNPNAFYRYLTDGEKRRSRRLGVPIGTKIKIISDLSDRLGFQVRSLFEEFYDNHLRNAIAHSDFVIADEAFRCRGGISGMRAFEVPYEILNQKILCSKAFISALLGLDYSVRLMWGERKGTAVPYDPIYKGLLEVIADEEGLMCGYKVHWPNESESYFIRTAGGIDMTNCFVSPNKEKVELFVGKYAHMAGTFSPLVEHDGEPIYTPLSGAGTRPNWPTDI